MAPGESVRAMNVEMRWPAETWRFASRPYARFHLVDNVPVGSPVAYLPTKMAP